MNELTVYNKEQFVLKYEPGKMVMEYRHINSIEKAVNEEKNGISVYVKELGFDTVQALIELHLVALNHSVNVSNPLTTLQIKEISIEILTSYYFLSMVEIGFIFRKAKRGDYGKFYNCLSMPEILHWFHAYSEERMNYWINENTKDRHNDHSLRSEQRKELKRHERINGKQEL